MEFAFISYWPWLLILPALAGALIFVSRRSQKIIRLLFSYKDYKYNHPYLKLAIRLCAIFIIIIALLGPIWGDKDEDVPTLGREIFILLDISGSMNAQDIAPSRLDHAKKILKPMLRSLSGDKIGLIVFADHAYIQCPLTQDTEAVEMFLELVSPGQLVQTGTEFRSGLALALDRFEKSQSSDNYYSRIVILLSDGEDFGNKYGSIIHRLLKTNTKVFPVGIGTVDGGPVPNINQGKVSGYKVNSSQGRVISSRKDEDLLSLASLFNSSYTVIENENANLSDLTQEILGLNTSRLSTRAEKISKNRYQWVLSLAICILMFSMIMMPLKK